MTNGIIRQEPEAVTTRHLYSSFVIWKQRNSFTIMTNNLNRRDFVKRSGLVGAGIAAAQMLPLRFLQAQELPEGVPNPLAAYPNRDWEKLYRNQYAYDYAFSWVCAP